MSDLVRDVIGQLGPEQLQAMARQLGINPAQAQDAVEKAVPLMLGGMARNATAPDGASALHGALQRDHANVEPAGLLNSILGSGGSQEGLGIIGHIFGQQRDTAAQGLGESSGIGAPAATQLMGMLAPLLMAVMGNMTRSQGLDAGRLGQELGNQPAVRGGMAGGLLEALLGRGGGGDGGGQISQVMQAGSALLRAFGKSR